MIMDVFLPGDRHIAKRKPELQPLCNQDLQKEKKIVFVLYRQKDYPKF